MPWYRGGFEFKEYVSVEEKRTRAPFPQAEVRAERCQKVGCDFPI